MINKDIVNFAVNILGCQCDNSVFSSIEKYDNILLNCGIRLKNKIIIGKRLMIYIADETSLSPKDVWKVIIDGKTERDSMMYNRLRIVIVADRINEIAPVYYSEFDGIKEKDERIHIHVIRAEDSIRDNV